MNRIRVAAFSVSIDGYGAGPEQSLQDPMGLGGTALHEWAFHTPTFQRNIFGREGGSPGIDEDYAARSFENIGAWILGRNMFSPHRGPWDESWKGWWGDTPPYGVPVFVLTHHARPALQMQGGTTFHFVTEGADVALARAREAAKGRDVRIGGGVQTLRHYLRSGAIDEMHLAISPVLLGRGEAVFAGIDLPTLGWRRAECVSSALATHIVLQRG